jgi:hypothetical protein
MDQTAIRAAAAQEFARDPSLQREFTSLAAYQAWRVADARGIGRKSISTVITGITSPAAPSPALTAPAAHRAGVVSGHPVATARDEFIKAHASFSRRELVAHIAARCSMTTEQASAALIEHASKAR